jgi:hypothetical protein
VTSPCHTTPRALTRGRLPERGEARRPIFLDSLPRIGNLEGVGGDNGAMTTRRATQR